MNSSKNNLEKYCLQIAEKVSMHFYKLELNIAETSTLPAMRFYFCYGNKQGPIIEIFVPIKQIEKFYDFVLAKLDYHHQENGDVYSTGIELEDINAYWFTLYLRHVEKRPFSGGVTEIATRLKQILYQANALDEWQLDILSKAVHFFFVDEAKILLKLGKLNY